MWEVIRGSVSDVGSDVGSVQDVESDVGECIRCGK